MSSEIQVAIISGGASIFAVIVSRVLSHFEHRKTNDTINRIEIKLNGDFEKRIQAAVEAALKK